MTTLLSGVVEVLSATESRGQTFPMMGMLNASRLRDEIRADARPRVTAIVGAIDEVARPVQPPRTVRADDVRRIPVHAIAGPPGRSAAASALRRLRRCAPCAPAGFAGVPAGAPARWRWSACDRPLRLRRLRRLRLTAAALCAGGSLRRPPLARPAARPASRRLRRRRVRHGPSTAAAGSTAIFPCADRAARCRRSATTRRRCRDRRDRCSTGSRRRR